MTEEDVLPSVISYLRAVADILEASTSLLERLAPERVELWARSAVDGKRMQSTAGMPDAVALDKAFRKLREVPRCLKK